MKHIIIGTAGHVDHGKTLLTQALTGVNTDRLKEEQLRGITIELGFAQLTLPGGITASIIDVPGHEKLIHNMLTGATGIDVVMLIVAADEGFMPQTFEHLNILNSLGIKNGIIVITKTDLVDDELLELVKMDVLEHVRGTFLEDSSVIPVSAYTGAGIDALKSALAELLTKTPSRSTDRPFRLPVDRVFTVKGFGTVVTGTLVDGTLHTGDEVIIYPSSVAARVRELQNHDVKLDSVEAGMRVAINFSGLDRNEIVRGCTVAAPGSILLSDKIGVELCINADSPYSVKNNSSLHFYQGTQKLVCSVRLLDRQVLEPGEKAYAQLIFKDKSVSARNLDRFVIRFFSPVITIGGGTILDMGHRKIKRNDIASLARMEQLNGTPEERILRTVMDAGYSLVREDELNLCSGLSNAEVRSALRELQRSGEIVKLRGQYAAKSALDECWFSCETILKEHHRKESLMSGMNLGEFRERAFPGAGKTADWLIDYYREKGVLRVDGSTVALDEFRVNYSPQQAVLREQIHTMLAQNGVVPCSLDSFIKEQKPDVKLLKQVVAKMLKDGTVVALTPMFLVDAQNYQKALTAFYDMFRESETVAIGDYRTLMGINRKQAELYLNYFDNNMISRLIGDRRVLLKKI